MENIKTPKTINNTRYYIYSVVCIIGLFVLSIWSSNTDEKKFNQKDDLEYGMAANLQLSGLPLVASINF